MSLEHDTSLDGGIGPPRPFPEPMVACAREVYRSYCEAHVDLIDEPLGVAVNRHTYRGQLIFTDQPILLPHELFVPVEQLIIAESVVVP